MKFSLLPHYGKRISLLLLASTGVFWYLRSPVGLVVALIAGVVGWLWSAERIEDERIAHQRLLAIRASAITAGLFGIGFALLRVSGLSASPSLFCAAPIVVVVYLCYFYGSTYLGSPNSREE